jgi:hypothetical protein
MGFKFGPSIANYMFAYLKRNGFFKTLRFDIQIDCRYIYYIRL